MKNIVIKMQISKCIGEVEVTEVLSVAWASDARFDVMKIADEMVIIPL